MSDGESDNSSPSEAAQAALDALGYVPKRIEPKAPTGSGLYGLSQKQLEQLKIAGAVVGALFLFLMLPPVRRAIWYRVYSIGLGMSSTRHWGITGMSSLALGPDEVPQAVVDAVTDPEPGIRSVALTTLIGSRVKPVGWMPAFVANGAKANQAAINALKREDRRMVIDALLSPDVHLSESQRTQAQELLLWMCQELDDGVKKLLENMAKPKAEADQVTMMRYALLKLNARQTFTINEVAEFTLKPNNLFEEDMVSIYFDLCDHPPEVAKPPGCPPGKERAFRTVLLDSLEKLSALPNNAKIFLRMWDDVADPPTQVRIRRLMKQFHRAEPLPKEAPVVEAPRDPWADNAMKQLESAPTGQESSVVKSLFQDPSFGKLLRSDDLLPSFLVRMQKLASTLDCDALAAVTTRLLAEPGQAAELLGVLLSAGVDRCPAIRKDLTKLCARSPEQAGAWFASHLAGGPPAALWLAISTNWPPGVAAQVGEAVLGSHSSWPTSLMFLFLPEDTQQLKTLLVAIPTNFPTLTVIRGYSEKARLAAGRAILENPDPKTRIVGAEVLGSLACGLVDRPDAAATAKDAIDVLRHLLENEFDANVGMAATCAIRGLVPFAANSAAALEAIAMRKTSGGGGTTTWDTVRKAALLGRLSLPVPMNDDLLDAISAEPFYGEQLQGISADWVMKKGLDAEGRLSAILGMARREGETGWNQDMCREEIGALLKVHDDYRPAAVTKLAVATQIDAYGLSQGLLMCPQMPDSGKLLETIFTAPTFSEGNQMRMELLHSIARSGSAVLVGPLCNLIKTHTALFPTPDKAPVCSAACAAHLLGDLHQDAGHAGPALVGLMKSKEPGDRIEACLALGKFGPAAKDYLASLGPLEKDEETAVRYAAWQAAYRILGETSH